ncbi:MAG TPA: hypothetical protein H9731_03510 [Candidatus Borkfalkia excrementipullorum]|nr:hypothetical protein [Candidatus Borkfalkia excrementipullorum]
MKIVFLGDSITEGGRDRSDPASLGSEYVELFYNKLRNLYEDIPFIVRNRGVSGDCVADMRARLEADVLSEKPDVVVVLAGVNDVVRERAPGEPFDADAFAADYEDILRRVKECGAKLIVAEPFLFAVPDKKRFRRNFDAALAKIRALAAQYADAHVSLDEIFAGVSQNAGIAAYSPDGVHPTHRAERLIADNIIKKLAAFL